jgi:glucose-6-phosphate 1-dehydrogenase
MNHETTYIIFGASGDLSKRYLMPAIKNLQNTKNVSAVIPVSRKDYGNLKNLIKESGLPAQTGEKIFHLAIPPEGVPEAVRIISENFGKDKENKLKIVLEKPFGSDLKSAQDLIKHIDKYFSEDQIYRVDHYLAKNSLQNVIKEKWTRDNVASIHITASEKIDIEGRVNFYEQTGALKDFVQNHLIEMTAVVLSGSFEVSRREEALKNLEIVCDISKNECVKRGQYEGYRGEVNNPDSMIETFVSINLVSNLPLWRGVPIVLSTGKALNKKFTQIKIKYKNGNEKGFNIEHEPETYERVIGATISGNHDLFVSGKEVAESWRILDAVQKTWAASKDKLIVYKKGSTVDEVLEQFS